VWVVGVRNSGSDSADLISATFDAESMAIQATTSSTLTAANNVGVALADLQEVDIPGGSNILTAAHDPRSGSYQVSGVPLTLTGVDQSGPVDFSINGSNDTSQEILDFDVVEGGIAIIAVVAQTGTDATGTPSGYTALLSNVSVGAGTAEMSVAYKLITADGTETGLLYTGTGTGQWRTLGLSYGPAVVAKSASVVLKRVRGF
jgi:hypothetical protein